MERQLRINQPNIKHTGNKLMEKFDYYPDVQAGLHTFIHKAIEHIKDDEPTAKYSTVMNYGLHQLDIFAAEQKAEIFKFPAPFLMAYTDHETDPSKIKVKQRWIEGVWCFKVGTSKVFAANLAYMQMDYDEIYCSNCSFIIAPSKAESDAFLISYHKSRWSRNRQNGCVLNYTGERMDEFRKMQWDDIFLPNNTCEQIRNEIDTFFKSEKDYKEHGLDWKRGIILAGKPGNGKTSLARAIATNSTVPVIYCALDSDDMFRVLDRVQRTIKGNAPCIVIFEDADSLASNPALRSAMLNMLDGLFTASGVLTIASTNSPEKLDEAFTGRPSRFDSYYVIGDPPLLERKGILLRRLGKKGKKLPLAGLKELCKQMAGLSAACVQEIAVCALLESLRSDKPISMPMLYSGLEKMRKHMKVSTDGLDKFTRGSLGFAPISDDIEDF
jgi:AAA+ superfamily predicted ATPase